MERNQRNYRQNRLKTNYFYANWSAQQFALLLELLFGASVITEDLNDQAKAVVGTRVSAHPRPPSSPCLCRTGCGEMKTHSSNPKKFRGTAVSSQKNPKLPEQSMKRHGVLPRACEVCGLQQVPASLVPTSQPHHSWDFKSRKTSATTRGSHNLKLEKPKPTQGLVTSHHGDKETGLLSTSLLSTSN